MSQEEVVMTDRYTIEFLVQSLHAHIVVALDFLAEHVLAGSPAQLRTTICPGPTRARKVYIYIYDY